ncbi:MULTISPECIES: tRNA (adenosine(37)-N6)-threonylcarbamoyltransferase complex dimerization subunit type 1 TsaB [unclassified Luteococcus]|uniref:tRNA (adenosine(37)-N6)-threonylcarbamoyltransferase complex dimerization subunit type 1 TsaB n=1 Tax=unclassified Luteococcus TaxID=2639923 RepID=UPI00313B712E
MSTDNVASTSSADVASKTTDLEPGAGWALAIDTSTDICIGLAHDGRIVASDRIDDRRGHAEKLMPLIQAMCARMGIAVSDITEVAVGLGPGPFTGLRVGIVTGHTIASLAGAPMHGVCSLDIVAKQWLTSDDAPEGEFVVASDARRKELYWARYAADGTRTDGPHVSAPADLPAGLPIAGPGRSACPELFVADGPDRLDAGILATRWAELPDAGSDAMYLRKPDAVAPTTRKSTLLSSSGARLSLKPLQPRTAER